MPLLRCITLKQRLQGISAAVILLAFSHSSLCQVRQSGNAVIGDWKLTAAVDSADIAMRDEKGAQKLVGHVMSIREDGTRLDNDKCGAPTFEVKRVEPNLYLEKEGGLDNSKLRLPKPVTVVDIGCAVVFVKNRNRAVITWDGWFFEATRVKR